MLFALSCDNVIGQRSGAARDLAPSAARSGPAPQGVATSGDGAAWTVEYRSVGLAAFRYDGSDILVPKYLFFGPEWKWEGHQASESAASGGAQDFAIHVPNQGVEFKVHVTQTGPGELTYDYVVKLTKKLEGIRGSGLEWKLNRRALPPQSNLAKPELIEGSRGFRWQVDTGGHIEVVFDRALPLAYFEAGRPDTIRLFFIGKDAEPGEHRYQMKIRAPAGGRVVPSLASRYAAMDANWHEDTLVWNEWPVDLRFLNDGDRPAGSHGMLGTRGDELVFSDKTPARFWGTNIQAGAIFNTSKQDACRQAERIAAFGYNLVRLHHHDSKWVSPNIFDPSEGTTQKLNPASMDSIDWWIKCLADQGVYTFLDLNVGRVFLRGDNVPGVEENESPKQAKGLAFANSRIEALMQRFASDYLQHKNPYRGKRLVDDPAIAAVLISNENDLVGHFIHRFEPGGGSPVHAEMLQAVLDKFSKERGLPPIAVADGWKPGLPQIALAGIESAFFERAIRHLRALGVSVPIVTTSYWGGSFASLPPVSVGNLIDAHSYGEAEYLGQSPRGTASYLAWIAPAQLTGKPLAVSEWALEATRRDRFVAPLHFAAVAALQGWDMPMHFTYQQVRFAAPNRIQLGSNSYDPGIMAMMPAAALLFRRQDVRKADEHFVLQLSRKDVYQDGRNPNNSVTVRTLVERSQLSVTLPDVPELASDDALPRAALGASVEVITDLDRDFIPPGDNRVVSDTGELMRDWEAGLHTIDTPRTQAAAGWIGGRDIKLRDALFRLRTPKAAIALSSLDGQPLARSRSILVSTAAQIEPGQAGAALPYHAEPVVGDIELRGALPGLRLIPLTPSGKRLAPIAPRVSGEAQIFSLPADTATHWYMLEPPSTQPGTASPGPN